MLSQRKEVGGRYTPEAKNCQVERHTWQRGRRAVESGVGTVSWRKLLHESFGAHLRSIYCVPDTANHRGLRGEGEDTAFTVFIIKGDNESTILVSENAVWEEAACSGRQRERGAQMRG